MAKSSVRDLGKKLGKAFGKARDRAGEILDGIAAALPDITGGQQPGLIPVDRNRNRANRR